MKTLILLTSITFIGFWLVLNPSPSKNYWDKIGPSWDKMLNPDTHSETE